MKHGYSVVLDHSCTPILSTEIGMSSVGKQRFSQEGNTRRIYFSLSLVGRGEVEGSECAILAITAHVRGV